MTSYFEVSPSELTLDPQGGQEILSIRSSEDWLIRSTEKWVRAATSSGKASSEVVKATITYDANTTGSARETVLTVKTLNGKTVDVTVSQAKLDGPLAQRGISNAEDLLAFAHAVNNGETLTPFMDNGSVVLLNDIDASSIKEWVPAGTKNSPFIGNFNGKGFSIRNINWTVDVSKYPAAGIIGYSKGAAISSLTVGTSSDVITISGAPASFDFGAVVGVAEGGQISGCKNLSTVKYLGTSSGKDIRVAGICGASSNATVSNCSNNGNILCSVVCRAAGFVAYNEGEVSECTNKGCILAEKSGEIGPAWACSYNKSSDKFIKNVGQGHVGDYATYSSNPSAADADAYLNAVVSPAKEGYDMAQVSINTTAPSYFDWTEKNSKQLANGVKYSYYECDNVPRKVHVLEIDLSDPSVEVTTSYANDCVPNPNGNNNSNNGFKIRETLSQLCDRKRSEGQNIIAGINTGFFDSNDGISRGFHIEEGEPVYVNNPAVVNGLPNHAWGLTVFTDGTASCGKKKLTGKMRLANSEFEWCSMNDTILRNVSKNYQVNLYDRHYKRYPHAAHTNLENKLAKNALYVVAEYNSEPMKVNCGYAAATVTSIVDGRSSALTLAPYVTAKNQVVVSLSGDKANAVSALVQVGSTIEFKCDMTIEGETTRPIYTQNSTMYHLYKDGVNNMGSVGSTASLHTTQDPLTFPVISKDKKKLWLVEVDGRQGWYATGITGHELCGIATKLGGYNATRFDGGGSSAMWIYDSATGKGKIVNSVSDSKGERSCLNYMMIKIK